MNLAAKAQFHRRSRAPIGGDAPAERMTVEGLVKKQMICAAIAVLALSAPASAQGYGYGSGALPPYEVVTILRSAGFDPLGPPRLRGPNYVIRAFDRRDREVRVIVNAQSGNIVAVRPFDVAARELPPGARFGGYEQLPPGYVPQRAYRGGYAPRPDVDDDDDAPPPRGYSSQPPSAAPGNLPRSSNAAPPPRGGYARPQNDDEDASVSPSEPNVIRADPDRGGALPPPPERFPQRVGPQAEKPKPPVKRAAVAAPKPAPLPKPKPAINASAPAPAPAAKPTGKFDEPPTGTTPAPAQAAPQSTPESPPDQTSPREPATAVPN